VTDQYDRLEWVVQQMGETVLAATITIEHLAERLDHLSTEVQQQGYEIFALSDAVQTLTQNQDDSLLRLAQLTETLQGIVSSLEKNDADH
jgi:FtsZ-binding cell division protein ZapB